MSKHDDSNGRGGYTVGDILGAAFTGAAHAVMRLLQSGGPAMPQPTAAPSASARPTAKTKAAMRTEKTAKPRRSTARRTAKPRRSSANDERTP